MELPSYNNMILSSENTGKEFTIKASAKAFRILSGMYTNKIQAIVREIGCNAFDSHVEAGREEIPFDVYLPNAIEPWFTIKDTGLGLSKDQFETLYSTYFDSTKTSTNAQDGALGLGSKSPFSYTDQYNVVSVHNGIKLNYQLYLGMDGTPEFDLLSEEETDERNGVELRVPVKEGDYEEFEKECYRVYQWFNTRPCIHGGHNGHSYISEEGIETYGNCMVISSLQSLRMYDPGLYVKMGNVLYRASASEAGIEDNSDLPMLNRLISKKHRSSIILTAQRGDLDILPTREGISFDPRTKSKLLEIAADADRSILAELNSFYDNKTKIADFRGSKLFDHFLYTVDMEFNGRKFKEYQVNPYREFHSLMQGLPMDYRRTISEFSKRVKGADSRYNDMLSINKMHRIFSPWETQITILYKDVRKELAYNRRRLKTTGYFECSTDEELESLCFLFEDFDVDVKYLSKEIEAGHCEPKETKDRRRSSNDPLVYVFERAEPAASPSALRLRQKDIISMAQCAVERDGHCVIIAADMRTFNISEYKGWNIAYPQAKNIIAVNQTLGEKILKTVDGAVPFNSLEACPKIAKHYWLTSAYSLVYGRSTHELDDCLKSYKDDKTLQIIKSIFSEMNTSARLIKRFEQAQFLFAYSKKRDVGFGDKIKIKNRGIRNTDLIRREVQLLNDLVVELRSFISTEYPLLGGRLTDHLDHAKLYIDSVRNSKKGAV